VLYFYPKDFTSGCTIEAHNFQRDLDKYTAKNAVIVGVSVDNVDSHKSFCTKEGLNFKLLADPNHAVVAKYGSVAEYNGMTIATRNTFLIDPTGVIRKVYLKVSPRVTATKSWPICKSCKQQTRIYEREPAWAAGCPMSRVLLRDVGLHGPMPKSAGIQIRPPFHYHEIGGFFRRSVTL
jgi:peroxiredoxin